MQNHKSPSLMYINESSDTRKNKRPSMLGNFPATVRLLGVAPPWPINTSRLIPNHQQFSLSVSPLTLFLGLLYWVFYFYFFQGAFSNSPLWISQSESQLSHQHEFSFTAMDEREDVSTDLKLGLSTSSFDDNGVSASLR